MLQLVITFSIGYTSYFVVAFSYYIFYYILFYFPLQEQLLLDRSAVSNFCKIGEMLIK